jgi:tetratricopeptide (TPR) repeat protein
VPDAAPAHLGLANACLLRFEMTRADPQPDVEARARAAHHAREAVRLDAGSAEAWATLAVVLDREGDRSGALAAVDRAIALEPSSWRHHFRRATIDWGDGRLRAARRVLTIVPGFPAAHWMAATVQVARQAIEPALGDLSAGLAADPGAGGAGLGSVALAWLRGLVHLSQGDDARALADFERELSTTRETHLYARETRANTHYAIGALHHRQGRLAEAASAFEQTLALVPGHPGARAALGREAAGSPADRAIAHAVTLAMRGQTAAAAATVLALLEAAPPGNAAWFVPVEPLLRTSADPAAWAPVLARLRQRAS